MGVWLLVAVLPSAHAACEELGPWLEALEGAILEARFDDARATLDEIDDRLSCGEPIEPPELGRIWVAEGVLAHLTGDTTSAGDAFRAAARVADDPWPDVFGAELKRSFDGAVAQPVGGVGEVTVDGGEGFAVWFDGRPATLPTGASVGLHAVQLVDRREVVWARVFFLSPQQTLVLGPQGLPEPSPAPELPVPEPLPRSVTGGRSPALLIAGASSLALGVGAAGVALAQTPRMQAAPDLDTLQAAWTRQRVFGVAAYTLLGLGAAGITVHVVR